MKETKVHDIISKAGIIADVLIRHLEEKDGCNHKIDVIVEEAFGPSFEGRDHNPNISNQTEEVTT